MAISLNGTIKRQVNLHGIASPVNVVISTAGIEISVVGHRKRVSGSWERVASCLQTPGDVPSYLEGKPMELLKAQSLKRLS